MPSTWLGSGKYAFLSHWFDSTRVCTHVVRIPQSLENPWETDAQLIRPSRLVSLVLCLEGVALVHFTGNVASICVSWDRTKRTEGEKKQKTTKVREQIGILFFVK